MDSASEFETALINAVLEATPEEKPAMELIRDILQHVIKAHRQVPPGKELQKALASLAAALNNGVAAFMAMSVREKDFEGWTSDFAESVLETAREYRSQGLGQSSEELTNEIERKAPASGG